MVVAGGSEVLPESRIGAPIGGAISTDAAIAASQSSVGAIVTAVGWVPGAAEGNTASATPAALAIESAPDTRVVFLVASTGNPTPAAGGAVLWLAVVVFTINRVAAPPQPATVNTQAARAAISRDRRIAPDVSGAEGRSPHFAVRAPIAAICGKTGAGPRAARFPSHRQWIYCRDA